jgi:hypothetical protein
VCSGGSLPAVNLPPHQLHSLPPSASKYLHDVTCYAYKLRVAPHKECLISLAKHSCWNILSYFTNIGNTSALATSTHTAIITPCSQFFWTACCITYAYENIRKQFAFCSVYYTLAEYVVTLSGWQMALIDNRPQHIHVVSS